MDAFREFFEKSKVDTIFLTTLDSFKWVSIKSDLNTIVWLESSNPSFNGSNTNVTTEKFWATYETYGRYNILVDYIEPDEKHISGLCVCDFYSVVLVTGCKCGGK